MIHALRRRWLAALATLSAAIALCAPASAESITLGPPPGGQLSFQDGVLVWPSSFDVREFVSAVAGTVTLSVQRTPDWGDLLSQLSTTVALFNRPAIHLSGNATTVFDVTAGEAFGTSITALAAGPAGFSGYQLDVEFLPRAVSQVPLPASGWLLLSGAGVFVAGVRRRRAAVARLI